MCSLGGCSRSLVSEVCYAHCVVSVIGCGLKLSSSLAAGSSCLGGWQCTLCRLGDWQRAPVVSVVGCGFRGVLVLDFVSVMLQFSFLA
jgi:hypothetical protein